MCCATVNVILQGSFEDDSFSRLPNISSAERKYACYRRLCNIRNSRRSIKTMVSSDMTRYTVAPHLLRQVGLLRPFLKQNILMFSGASPKQLRNANIIYHSWPSVYLSVPIEKLGSHSTNFRTILYLKVSLISRLNSNLVKIGYRLKNTSQQDQRTFTTKYRLFTTYVRTLRRNTV